MNVASNCEVRASVKVSAPEPARSNSSVVPPVTMARIKSVTPLGIDRVSQLKYAPVMSIVCDMRCAFCGCSNEGSASDLKRAALFSE